MNKYKIVCIVLALSLLGALARLVYVSQQSEPVIVKSKSEVVLENIFSRKSVRSFTDQAVSRGQLDTLVRAAMAAPTGRDMRPWKFVIVDERAAMDSLAVQLPYAKMLQTAQIGRASCRERV